METKANHLLIGSFVLVLTVALFGFLIWIARIQVAKEYDYYTIYFRDSVAGLGVGGDVRYNGIKVGSVSDIDFDINNLSQVKVTVQVAGGTPIKEDAMATLQPQGLTGLSFVQISGGSSNAPMLVQTKKEPYSVITAQPSTLGRLVEDAPVLLAKGIALLDNANDVIGPENKRALAAIFADIAKVTGRLAARAPEIDRILISADATAADLSATIKALRNLSEQLDPTLKLARGAIGDVQSAARSVNKAADSAQQILAENREPIGDFAGEGLAQFGRFVSEARILVQTLSRVAERIESDPAQFIFGGRAPEYKPK